MTPLVLATMLLGAFGGHLWYMLPLCLVIALVYHATRREDMRFILRLSVRLFVIIIVGMVAVGGVLALVTLAQ